VPKAHRHAPGLAIVTVTYNAAPVIDDFMDALVGQT
jgi:hypothetical protein